MDRINNTLKVKASEARTRVAHKQQTDCDCDYTKVLHSKPFKILSALQYIRGFLDDENIDKPIVFEELDMDKRKVHADEYVYAHQQDSVFDIDDTWIEEQNKYVRSLTKEQLFNLYAYTHKGDSLVNAYMRDEMYEDDFIEFLERFRWHNIYYFPLFFPALRVFERYSEESLQLIFNEHMSDSDRNHAVIVMTKSAKLSERYRALSKITKKLSYNRFWISCLTVYENSIHDIINGAPVTETSMLLYRGSFTDHFLRKYISDRANKLHVSKGFMSCSSSVHVATKFTSFDCCFIRIMIPVKTKLLLLAGVSKYEESEFLLDTNTQFYITKSYVEKFCNGTDSVRKMRISNMVVIM